MSDCLPVPAVVTPAVVHHGKARSVVAVICLVGVGAARLVADALVTAAGAGVDPDRT